MSSYYSPPVPLSPSTTCSLFCRRTEDPNRSRQGQDEPVFSKNGTQPDIIWFPGKLCALYLISKVWEKSPGFVTVVRDLGGSGKRYQLGTVLLSDYNRFKYILTYINMGTNKLAYARLFPFKNTMHVLHEAMNSSSMFGGRELTSMKFSFLKALWAKIELFEKFGATQGSEFNQPISEQWSMSNPSQLSPPRGLHEVYILTIFR